MVVEHPPHKEPGPPPDPRPPPDEGNWAPEATNAHDAQRDELAPNENDARTHAPTDDIAATSASYEAHVPSTTEGGEQGAANAPVAPNTRATRCHPDERVERAKADPTQAPSIPRMGHYGPKRPATAPVETQAALLTAAEFYTSMNTIMTGFSETISAKIGQSIADNQNTSQESTRLIRDEIRAMSEASRADAASTRDELRIGLRGLTQAITDFTRVTTVQGASVQALIDSLRNREYV